MMDSVPVVFITGQVRTELLGTDGFQEADTLGITIPIVKHSFMIQDPQRDPARDPRGVLHRALRPPGPGAGRHPAGPLARRDRVRAGDRRAPARISADEVEGNQKQIRQAAKALAAAQRPVIYAGGGVVNANASEELVEFATSDRFPVTCTLMGLGGVPGHGGGRTGGYPIPSGWGCSACTARARRTTRWTRPT